MPVELRPFGVKCNIHCHYCYQNPQRDAANVVHSYDLDVMKAAVVAEGGGFTLFGGEPLLLPEADLEELWSWGYDKYGKNGIQTNGSLINANHIQLFKKYNVHVGISMDGPGELNDLRWAGTLNGTRAATAKSEAAIRSLCSEGVIPSLIITLHRGNATSDKLPTMHQWIRSLQSIGIRSMRLHALEIEDKDIREKYALTDTENIAAFLSFLALSAELTGFKFDLFDDMERMLLGRDESTTCVWNACDPYTTRAVRGVEGHGQRTNCGRTNKDGVDFVKADYDGFERYLALYDTPQDDGGCKGCRFFLMCKGQCPGTAIDGDWRNRTELCNVWMTLYHHVEDRLLATGRSPLSTQPIRQKVERAIVESWAKGRAMSMSMALKALGANDPKT